MTHNYCLNIPEFYGNIFYFGSRIGQTDNTTSKLRYWLNFCHYLAVTKIWLIQSVKKSQKNSQYKPWHSFFAFETSFFGFLDSFYIKNELRYFFANTRRSKIKWLSKVPQICPNFWLMTSYQKMGWFWDDETSFFELSGQFYIKIHLFHQESAIIFVIINPFLSGTRYWKITEICKSAPGDVIRACTLLHNEICVLKTLFKHPTSNGHNSAKKQYFLMRFFCWLRMIKDFQFS